MKAVSRSNPLNRETTLTLTFNDEDAMLFGRLAVQHAISIAAHTLAEDFLKERGAELLAEMDPAALANLAVAQAGRQVAEAITTRPVVLRETETEIYQKGVFGGIKRVR